VGDEPRLSHGECERQEDRGFGQKARCVRRVRFRNRESCWRVHGIGFRMRFHGLIAMLLRSGRVGSGG